VLHQMGWELTVHPDGTSHVTSPSGRIIRSHSPPLLGVQPRVTSPPGRTGYRHHHRPGSARRGLSENSSPGHPRMSWPS
jgi:hypothetical protein